MRLKTSLLAAALALACAASQAVTLRVANVGDVQSMDPHSLNETLQLSFTASVYEPLVGRGKDMALTPLLATKWTQVSPNVWRFDLRKAGRGALDGDGRVHGLDNVHVADASALPGSPGVNPQATIMAVARRCAIRYVERIG